MIRDNHMHKKTNMFNVAVFLIILTNFSLLFSIKLPQRSIKNTVIDFKDRSLILWKKSTHEIKQRANKLKNQLNALVEKYQIKEYAPHITAGIGILGAGILLVGKILKKNRIPEDVQEDMKNLRTKIKANQNPQEPKFNLKKDNVTHQKKSIKKDNAGGHEQEIKRDEQKEKSFEEVNKNAPDDKILNQKKIAPANEQEKKTHKIILRNQINMKFF